MRDLTPSKDILDPIEIASRDEIEALQLQRLKWTLAHAYENVPLYRRKFDEAGVHPDDLKRLTPAQVRQKKQEELKEKIKPSPPKMRS